MALTVTLDTPMGVKRIARGVGLMTGAVAFDNSYPTGGEDCSGISRYFSGGVRINFNPTSGYLFEYDVTNDKVIVRAVRIWDNDNAAVAGVAVYFDDDGTLGERLQAVNANNADSYELIGEVPDTEDLSALTAVYFMAIGRT